MIVQIQHVEKDVIDARVVASNVNAKTIYRTGATHHCEMIHFSVVSNALMYDRYSCMYFDMVISIYFIAGYRPNTFPNVFSS
jgi:hypothetical protein